MPRIEKLSRFSTMGIRLPTCTTKTGRTWDLERERRTTDLVPRLRVPSSLLNYSAGCTIVTIELLENQEAAFERRLNSILYIYALWGGCRRIAPFSQPTTFWQGTAVLPCPSSYEFCCTMSCAVVEGKSFPKTAGYYPGSFNLSTSPRAIAITRLLPRHESAS